LTEYLPVGIVIHQNLKIVYANKKALKLLNIEEENEILGKTVTEFVKQDYQEIVNKRIQDIYNKDEEAAPIEEILLTIDKKPFYAEVRAKKILWNHQPAVLVIFQDISNHVYKRNFSEKSILLLQKIIQEKNINDS
jgi:PAS domain S-box-containing protein